MSNTPMGGYTNYGQPMSMMGQPQQPPKQKKTRARGTSNDQKRRITGVLAIALALIGGLLVYSTLSASKDTGMVYVLRAKQNILPLTPITESQLEVVQISATAVEPGVLKAAKPETVLEAARKENSDTTVIGRYALYPILAKQQIRIPSMLTADAQLRSPLSPDERLVTVNVSLARGVAGLVRTGDRVDIYTISGGSNSGASSQLLAENIEVVLAAPGEETLKAVGDANPGEDPLSRIPSYPVPAMYVVRAPLSLVTTLISADSQGSLYFVYRPVTGTDSTTASITDATPTTTRPAAPSTTASQPSPTAASNTAPTNE